MKNLIKNLIIILLIFLFVSAVFSLISQMNQKPKGVTLSELANQINQENVSKIVIQNQDVDVTLIDGTLEKSRKEEEASLSETLKNLGAQPEKLQKVQIEVAEVSSLKFWLINLLPFLLPLVIMGLFFWFMLRQAQRGATQAFGFTRSLVRMLSPQDKKGQRTTFKDVAGLKEAKEELREVVEFLRYPEKFKAVGARIPKGVLLAKLCLPGRFPARLRCLSSTSLAQNS